MASKTVVKLKTDYLVVGCGAMGIAFVDEILNTSSKYGNNQKTEFIIIDRHSKPGGHWNDAYQFVTLHQPAAYYGVNSKFLGENADDLVSKSQILAYFELVLKDFLKTGRVKFFSMCEYVGENHFKSLVDEEIEYEVEVRKKTVDGTYMDVQVPSITKPKFKVHSEVKLVPVNGIADVRSPFEKYVVLGAGKTGIDAVLFLMNQNVDPDKIIWIMPNDAWYHNRDTLKPHLLATTTMDMFAAILSEDIKTVEDMFLEYEKHKLVMRLDEGKFPTAYKCATVSSEELASLRKIKNIIRQGRIESLEKNRIVFTDNSEISTSVNNLHVDCTSNGLGKRPVKEIFNGRDICLQSIHHCQQVFSAAAIGAVEARYSDDDQLMNGMCTPVPHPEKPADYPGDMLKTLTNGDTLGKGEGLGFNWLRSSRLSALYHMSVVGVFKFVLFDMYHHKTLREKLKLLSVDSKHK